MNIIKLIKEKSHNLYNASPVTIAFLGDSVTQGCFEVFITNEDIIDTVYESENAFHEHFHKIMSMLYPKVPINIINAGISGSSTTDGVQRLERDILRFSPDMVVVSFGLNDAHGGIDKIIDYKENLKYIFKTLKKQSIETVFMTPNMLCTNLSPHIKDNKIKNIALEMSKIQNDGIMDAYIKAAIEICDHCNVKICDCYSKWKIMHNNGVNVTELLANKINHPTRDMNWLFAVSLIECLLD